MTHPQTVESRKLEDAGVLRELRCGVCGYGARCRVEPLRCPMCASFVWHSVLRELVEVEAFELDATSPLSRNR